jgi:LPXTG-site transpeptidase (sortase) family protein
MTLVGAPALSAPGTGTGRSNGTAGKAGSPAVPPAARRREARGPAAQARQTAGTALMFLGLTLFGYVLWFAFLSSVHYDRVQTEAYASFRATLARALAPTGPTQPIQQEPGKPVPANPPLLAPGTPVAVLNIPEIGLNAVVFEGTSGQVLENGPGHLRYTPLPGQVGTSVILGRRTGYGGPFSRVATLRLGDIFTATTGQGVARYEVIDVRYGGDRVPLPLTPGQGRLTLVTAAGPSLWPSGVVRVDANLVSTAEATPAMPLTVADMAPGELTLGTDTIAWLPIVLWGQCLLIAVGALSWAAQRWGRWQAWLVAVPVVGFLSLTIADQVTRLLPNLM